MITTLKIPSPSTASREKTVSSLPSSLPPLLQNKPSSLTYEYYYLLHLAPATFFTKDDEEGSIKKKYKQESSGRFIMVIRKRSIRFLWYKRLGDIRGLTTWPRGRIQMPAINDKASDRLNAVLFRFSGLCIAAALTCPI